MKKYTSTYFYVNIKCKENIYSMKLINRNLEVAIVEYGIVVAVVFVIAIGIYASLKNKKK